MTKNSGKMLPWIVAVALCTAAAAAQSAPPAGGPPGPNKDISQADRTKAHAQMCRDGYAHEVGQLADMEIRLQLTDKQKPAFEKWKAVKLSVAKAHTDACAAMPPPGKEDASPKVPSPVEMLKKRTQHLKDELAALKAEEPALEALAATLSEDQLRSLSPRHEGPHEMMRPHGKMDLMDGPHGEPMEPPCGPDGQPPRQ